jgi:hypothetical protein
LGALSLGPFARKDLGVSRDTTEAATTDATLGAAAAINPGGPWAKVSYFVSRGADAEERDGLVLNRAGAEKGLSPYLFYRGQTYQSAGPIKIVLEPLKDVIYVRVRQDPRTVPKDFRDQFRTHPNDGYMHYNEDLRYEVVVTNLTNRKQEIFVDCKMEQDLESERHEAFTLKESETRPVIRGQVRGVDLKKLGQKAPRSREVDLGRPRHLDIDIWDGPGRARRLGTRRVRFTHLDVEAYAAMLPVSYDSVSQRVTLGVRHLGSDPGKGYIDDVVASVERVPQPATVGGDGLGEMCKIRGDQYYGFWFGVDPKAQMVSWSVKICKKDNAFGAALTINPGGTDKEKDKDKDKEKDKDAEAPQQ